jgi:hypothetical protein
MFIYFLRSSCPSAAASISSKVTSKSVASISSEISSKVHNAAPVPSGPAFDSSGQAPDATWQVVLPFHWPSMLLQRTASSPDGRLYCYLCFMLDGANRRSVICRSFCTSFSIMWLCNEQDVQSLTSDTKCHELVVG